jgi:hypothetical protein
MTTRTNKFQDIEPSLPETLSLESIKQACTDRWLQRAAARPPEAGGAKPLPVQVYRPSGSTQ